ncbi:MAG: preprotein translocase subunit YajC [Woeseiaceae bacterium]
MNDAELISAVFIGVVVAFYFMFMRPAMKERDKHRQQIRDLRPGHMILTTSGFEAKVVDIQVPEKGQTRIKLELADGVIFTAVPSAIAQTLTESAGMEQKGASG